MVLNPVSEYRTEIPNAISATVDLAALFPSIIPEVEKLIYERVAAAASAHTTFPSDGSGLTLPAGFNIAPTISLYTGRDGSYLIPAGDDAGQPVPPIPVVRGWPAFPGKVPAIGVAESTTNDDDGDETIYGGFAGDVYVSDTSGNVIASAAYFAEPMSITVVVELIHVNRDERDRLHDQLRRVLYPLKQQASRLSPQIRGVRIETEKQDLPTDELPRPIYVSIFTLMCACEALIPTDITATGVTTEIAVTVTPSYPVPPAGSGPTVVPTPVPPPDGFITIAV